MIHDDGIDGEHVYFEDTEDDDYCVDCGAYLEEGLSSHPDYDDLCIDCGEDAILDGDDA